MGGGSWGIRVFWLLAGLALPAAGCAPQPNAMTAKFAVSAAAAPHSLRVDPVTTGEQPEWSDWDKPRLGNEEFQQALVASLTKSQLFQSVTVTEPAEWSLRATIASQKVAWLGQYRVMAELMVRYGITDAGGHSVWGDTVYTNKELGVGDVFFGLERGRVVVESVARDNITIALERIQDWLEEVPAGESPKS